MEPVRRPPNCTRGIQPGGAQTHTRPFSPTSSHTHPLRQERPEKRAKRKAVRKSLRIREREAEKNHKYLYMELYTVVAPEQIGGGTPSLSAQWPQKHLPGPCR